MRFISAEAAWTFALVFTYLLFFVLAVPDFIEYGYSDDKKANDGGIQSGPSGSGLFIVSLLLFICCTVTYGMKLVRCARARARAATRAPVSRDALARGGRGSPLRAAAADCSRAACSSLPHLAAPSSTSCPDRSRERCVLGGGSTAGARRRARRYRGRDGAGARAKPQPACACTRILHATRKNARRCGDDRLDA